MNANEHVKAFLRYYTTLYHPPYYALMISGKWGSGKTYLVTECLKEANFGSEIPHLYVSLYGVTNYKQIETAFFAQLHPLLASKGMKFATAIAKGMLSAAIKIDLSDQGHEAATVNVKAAGGSLIETLSKVGDRVLVFDDLERCKMGVSETLGYINSFVEHEDCKVIVIANEEEILNGPEGARYSDFKEKVIGRTLEATPEFDSAFKAFVSSISNAEPWDAIEKARADIKTIFEQSKTANLRLLQQTLWDYERFWTALAPRHRHHEQAAKTLLRVFFALSFEFKSGGLKSDVLTRFGRANWGAVFARTRGEKVEPSSEEKIAEKYPEADFGQTLLPYPLLSDILTKGQLDVAAILAALDAHHFFAPPSKEPSWHVVWQHYERSDEDVGAAIVNLEQEFRERRYTSRGEVLHVVGLRLQLAEVGELALSREDVVQQSKAYIDDLYKEGKLQPKARGEDWDLRMGYGGLSFREEGSAELMEVARYFSDAVKRSTEDKYPALATKLLTEMQTDTDLFLERFWLSGSPHKNIYYDVPILAFSDPAAFVETFLSLPRPSQNKVMRMFGERYNIATSKSCDLNWNGSKRLKLT
jgi:hypothetical protein